MVERDAGWERAGKISRLIVFDARVEKRVGEVYKKVHDHKDGGEEQRGHLDNGIVPSLNALQEIPADTGETKNLLDNYRAAQQHTQLDTNDSDDRNE